MSEGRKEGRLGRRLSDDEKKLWRDVTEKVAPLRKRVAKTITKTITKENPKTDDSAPAPASKPASRKAAVPVSQPVHIAKPKPPALAPLDRKTKSRIARGTHAIDAKLDLHGHTQAEAHDALLRFLRRASDKGAGVVLVITGKGARGDGERGVLKRQVPMWLSLPEFRDYVIGFDDAHVGHGGEGALYVRIRKRRNG